MRDLIRFTADHVVANDTDRRGCNEAYRYPDDRRRDHVNNAGVANLSRTLLDMERTVASCSLNRQRDLRVALLLTYITLGWMTIEGAASLLLGWASKSLLLEAFGIDSVIELFSAAVLLWRLRIEASGTATSEHMNFVERRAARLVGYSLYG